VKFIVGSLLNRKTGIVDWCCMCINKCVCAIAMELRNFVVVVFGVL